MAGTGSSNPGKSGSWDWRDTSMGGTAQAIRTSAQAPVALRLDNSANAAASYLKLWNLAVGSVTVGTTVPEMIVRTRAGVTSRIVIHAAPSFGTAVTGCAVTTGGTGGTTDPASSYSVRLYFE